MAKIQDYLESKFVCRSEPIQLLTKYIGDPNEAFPPAIYIYGHSGTGKTAIIKELIGQNKKFNEDKFDFAFINCVESYTTKILLENIVEILISYETRCDTLKDFISQLRRMPLQAYIIALDNAERLRDMDANILPSFLRLQELTGLNICVVLMSQLPFEKYYCKSGLPDILTIYCQQYNKGEALRILSADFSYTQHLLKSHINTKSTGAELEKRLQIARDITQDFFNNYLNLFISVFYKACRDVPELKMTARKCFLLYVEPILEGTIEGNDVSRLWRNIACKLKSLLAQVYVRVDATEDSKKTDSVLTTSSIDRTSTQRLAQSLELPYYGKYLLIAAYLASYNSAKDDKRLFVKNHGKQRKRLQTVNAKAKTTEKMSTSLGPKSFTIDRLLAIFYAILDEKVALTCNLLSQISTLVHLKLLSFISGENNIMDGSAKLQCTISLEFVTFIGKVVGFNVRQYLSDFI